MDSVDKIKLDIPLTIEKQLENYSRKEGHTERHETMWHAWYQNKRWFEQLLQITLHSFPTYSRHDETHALAVLNNIEMILGQERIAELSATDCFVLLHTVYIHDIGMCITQQDRKDIINNEKFIKMIDELQKEGDDTTKKAIEVLKRTEYSCDSKEDYITEMKRIYRAKLEVYYAIIQLIADYRRKEHGEKSAEKLYEWVLRPEKLGIGFSMSGVPLRIFLAIARCAQLHTSSDFNKITELPRKDGGYASDYYHPRFISVLLMLGDLLDMDNDRFHPMAFELVEDFPEISKNHYDKHRSIRKLHISSTVIEIEADCESQSALRLVRKECEMLKGILQDAGYMWSVICPEQFGGSLPTLGEVNLFLKGKKIPEELVTAQFNISQKKAFSILEGSNLYEGRFVFLREFLQNAIDASKMQYWYDYVGMVAYYYGEEVKDKFPDKMNQELPMDKFPIEIRMKMQKKDNKGKISDISEEEIRQIESGTLKGFEYGVTVFIKDFGTGIDKESICSIAKVGNSRLRDWKTIQRMPNWLRPTAEFGVGLQSAFLVTGSFKCYTHTRSGEEYEITFNSGSSSKYEGYINVIPLDKDLNKYESFGTCFEVFVPLDKKMLHSESVYTWSGSDPFGEDYENTRPFRHAAELISQMALYLDGMLGEILFPVILKIDTQSAITLALNTNSNNMIHKISYTDEQDWRKTFKKSWIYQREEGKSEFLFGKTQRIIYAFEYDSSRLYLWNQDINSFCAVSGKNLLKKEEENTGEKRKGEKKSGITIYYKGIELQCSCIKEEIEMFEYIDIKGELKRSYINISRRGFTVEGSRYFEESIYKELLQSVKIILKHINSRSDRDEIKEQLIKNIEDKVKNLSNKESVLKGTNRENSNYDMLINVAEQMITLSFLAHLALKDTHDEITQLGNSCSEVQPCLWQEIINEVCETLNKKEHIRAKNKLKEYTILFNIESFEVSLSKPPSCVLKDISILDIFNSSNHYGLLQVRANEFAEWKTYMIEVEADIYKKCEKLVLNDLEDEESKEEMEQWLERMLDIKQTVMENETLDKKYKQQFLLTWLAQSMPVVAVASNQTGNVRFNILSNYIFPCVYTNEEHKLLIVERILQIADERRIQRFSTYAWQGKQYLAVKRIPFSCYFTKRGFINHSSLQRVIFPLHRDILHEIADTLQNTDRLEFVKNVKLLAERLDYKAYFASIGSDNMRRSEKESKVWQKLLQVSKDTGRNITALIIEGNELFTDLMASIEWKKKGNLVDNKYWERMKLFEEEWQESYIGIMLFYLEKVSPSEEKTGSDTEVEELYTEEVMEDIHMGWDFLKQRVWKTMNASEYLKIARLKEEYLEHCRNDAKLMACNRNIIEYILQNSRYPIRQENLERCFEAFITEVFSLYEKIEERNVQEKLEQILVNL